MELLWYSVVLAYILAASIYCGLGDPHPVVRTVENLPERCHGRSLAARLRFSRSCIAVHAAAKFSGGVLSAWSASKES